MKLIAEPWDFGPGGYQVGGFPPGWAEWNDKFRDTVRAFWKGDEGMLPELATRLTASADLFNQRGRKPWASVNFITAHDGFTLNDLVSYNDKHNEANGEDNRDGHSRQPVLESRRRRADRRSRRSWRCASGRSATCSPRCCCRKARRCCSPATSSAARQSGNNNAYCQDNEISWVDWDHRRGRRRRCSEFVAQADRAARGAIRCCAAAAS